MATQITKQYFILSSHLTFLVDSLKLLSRYLVTKIAPCVFHNSRLADITLKYDPGDPSLGRDCAKMIVTI